MKSPRQKRLERAQMKVVLDSGIAFWASGVAKLPVVWDDSVPAAATDGQRIIWNGKWFDSLPDEVLPTVLCHEVAHCMLGHLWRAPAGVDWGTWNQATDHAVNLMLKGFSALATGKGRADPFPFPEPHDAYLADPAFAGMAEESIYAKLMSRPKSQGGQGKQHPKAVGAQGSGPGQSGGQGNKTSARGKSAPKPGSHSMPDFGQMTQPHPVAGGQSSNRALQDDWQGVLVQAARIAQGRGSLPGELTRLVESIVHPKIPWQEVLRSFLREQCSDDWDFLSPALEYDGSGFMLPSLRSERVGAVVFGSDWSGSTYGALVDAFHAEKQACLDNLRPAKLIDIGFDTRVVWEREYACGEQIERDIKGGGGTSFVDLFRRCGELQPSPKCVVVLTDLDGEFPYDVPPFPVIFCAYGSTQSAPFGTVVKVDEP